MWRPRQLARQPPRKKTCGRLKNIRRRSASVGRQWGERVEVVVKEEGERRRRKIAAEKGDLRAAGGGTIRPEYSITLSRILIE